MTKPGFSFFGRGGCVIVQLCLYASLVFGVYHPFSWFPFCFLSTNQEIGWEERLRNDLLRVKWDVKP